MTELLWHYTKVSTCDRALKALVSDRLFNYCSY